MTQFQANDPVTFENIDSMVQRLKMEKNYKQAMKYGLNCYNTSQYKINKVKLEEIPEFVNLIELNYINLEKDSDQPLDKKKYTWLANQLKLFVWVAVCHSYLVKKPLEEYEEHDWTFFTTIFTRKNCTDLEFQSKSLFKNYKGNKEKWDEEEEEILKLIIEDEQNKNKWNEISRLLYFKSNKKYYRSSQKCREYWFNHLDPSLNKNPWTIDEDIRLIKELQTYGFKWSKITQVIEATWGYRRTEHMVKNRTKFLCKKYGYKDEKQQGCMKELKMIEKKLIDEKVKSSQTITPVKEEEFLDSESESMVEKVAEKKQKEKPAPASRKKPTAKVQVKKPLSSSQQLPQPESSSSQQSKKFDEESSSESEEDYSDNHKHSKRKLIRKSSHDSRSNNKRNVIIIYQANQEKNMAKNEEEADDVEQEEESSEIVIGQHVEESPVNLEEEQCNEEPQYFDEYHIIEEVEEAPKLDLNEEIQFQHHTHGGTMRERVTHELAKFFPTPQNQTPQT